jgi:hypothetical protein
VDFQINNARWLDRKATANYICAHVDSLRRLVKSGKLPEPSYELGKRSPRWDRLALDAVFAPCRGIGGHNWETEREVAFRRIDAINRSWRSPS